jgi:hypothetical protein
MAEDTIIHHAGEEAAAVPDAVLDAVVSSAHDAGEAAAHIAEHGEKLVSHEAKLSGHEERLNSLETRINVVMMQRPHAIDDGVRAAVGELKAEVEELKEDAIAPVEAVVEPPHRDEPSEPPKKKSFWHRLI